MIKTSRVAALGTLVLVFAIALTWAIATRGSRRVPMTREVAREMHAGAEFALAVEHLATSAESLSVTDGVALGYLERLRLGLSSPFRLIDFALADRALPDSVRHLVAYALLQRTLDGDSYHSPVPALGLVGAIDELPTELAKQHVALIENVIAKASDPRAGELTVREAYRIAAAAGSVGRRAPWLSTQAAALARDRALARADVVKLLAMARRNPVRGFLVTAPH